MGMSVDELLSGIRPEVKKVYLELTDKWTAWSVNLKGDTNIIKHKKYDIILQVNTKARIYNLWAKMNKVRLTPLESAVMQVAYKLVAENFLHSDDIRIYDVLKEQIEQIKKDEKPKKTRGKGKDTLHREVRGK